MITFHKLAACIVLFLFTMACNTNPPQKSTEDKDKDLAMQCCKECVEAFGQSPVGVGAAGAHCGQFSTAKPLSTKCAEYFKANPKTVAECE